MMELSNHLCECGCGKFTYISPQNDSRYGYINGKPYRFFGRHYCKTESFKQKISEANIGNNNGMWKGDTVGYGGIHDWVKFHIERPKKCICCGKEKTLEVTNISGKYLRSLNDWEWLCRKCHMEKDGRIHERDKFGRFCGAKQ